MQYEKQKFLEVYDRLRGDNFIGVGGILVVE